MERIIRITGITLGMALLLLAVACGGMEATPTSPATPEEVVLEAPQDQSQPTSAPMMEPIATSSAMMEVAPAPVTAYRRTHGGGLQRHRRLGHR